MLLKSPDVIHGKPIPFIYPAEYLSVKIPEETRIHLEERKKIREEINEIGKG